MSKRPNYVFDDELYHFGIPGQRWGHRRFQYEDGSWTPEGRERYSEGERERFEAKDAYKTQKYKAKLESRAIKDAARRAASEERYRVRQAAKTERTARKEALRNDKALMKEQSKADREQSKLNNKLIREQAKEKDTTSLQNVFNRTKKYTMSDNELENAISRLKLEVEYNKQYALATKQNSALARADRFFESPTGKVVADIAAKTIPNVANTLASNISNKVLESKFKYANELDREKAKAEIEKTNAEANSFRTKADFQSAQADKERSIAENNRQKTINEANEAQNKIKLDRAKEAREAWGARAANALAKAADAREAAKSAQDLKIARGEAVSKIAKARQEIKNDQAKNDRLAAQQKHDIEMDTKHKVGYKDDFNNWVSGTFGREHEEGQRKDLNDSLNRSIKEKDADADRQIKVTNADLQQQMTATIQRNISYMAEHGIPGSAEYAKNASGAMHAALNVVASPKVNTKPVSSIIDTTTNLNTLLRNAPPTKATGIKEPTITAGTASAIRSAHGTIEEIARRFGVSPSTVSRIRS